MANSPYDHPPPSYSSHFGGLDFTWLNPVSPFQPMSGPMSPPPATLTPPPQLDPSDQKVAGIDYNELDLDTTLHMDLSRDLSRDTSTLVKEELREAIKKRRRSSGLSEVPLDDCEDCTVTGLTHADEERRRRRRESNRRAARKLRLKKAEQTKDLQKNYDSLVRENKQLKAEIKKLKEDQEAASSLIQTHLATCTLGDITTFPNELPNLDEYCLDLV